MIAYIKKEIGSGHTQDIDIQDDLLGNGIIDSMGMMSLVAFIEKEADLKIPSEDITVENFMTIEHILGYLSKQKKSDLG